MLNISLRSLKINKTMSEETTCFSAQVIIDGRHVFDVSNHGHGGADNWHPVKGGFTMGEICDLNNKIKETYPPLIIAHANTIPADLETVVAELITETEVIKDVRRHAKKKMLFLAVGEKITEAFRQIPCKTIMNPLWVAGAKAYIEKKYPCATILNDLTDDQITALVRKERAS